MLVGSGARALAQNEVVLPLPQTAVAESRVEPLLEADPLLRGLDRHPLLLVTAGAAIDVTTGWALYRYGERHARLAKFLFIGAAIYRGYLAAYNVHMMRQAELRAAAAAAAGTP